MPNTYFQFKHFKINQEKSSMKVGTDGILLGSLIRDHTYNQILDVGTGTGLLALMCAQRFSMSHVDGIEIDYDSFIQAKENFSGSAWRNKLSAHYISFQDFWSSCHKKYDLIVCNPPFFPNDLKSEVKSKMLSRHQVRLTHEDLVKGSKLLLREGGRLYVIIPFGLKEDFINLCNQNGLFLFGDYLIRTKPDKKFSRVVLSFSDEESMVYTKEITIADSESNYTEEFKSLTRDFYLDF